MKIDITHGVYHVMRNALRYRKIGAADHGAEVVGVTAFGVLLALLAEEEYRAAIWLTEAGIDHSQIGSQWPFEIHAGKISEDTETAESVNADLSPLRFFLDGDETGLAPAEPELTAALFSTVQQLYEILPRVVLSTEHLLHAISLENGEVGEFLRTKNVTPEHVFEQIRRQEGVPSSEPETLRITWAEIGEPDERPPVSRTGAQTDAEMSVQIDTEAAVYRILDASANRAMEAARVLEDYVRFALDDGRLVAMTKQLRHELASALRELPHPARFASRDTVADVGTAIEGPGEYRRASLADVLGANFSRLQESLRSLEEFGKLLPGDAASPSTLARTAEQLRYRSYTLQKAVSLSRETVTTQVPAQTSALPELRRRLAESRLYVLVDCRETQVEFAALVQAILDGGADVIQLRDKRADDRTLLQRAEQLRKLTAGSQTLMIVNDRPDIALLCDADGVHVGQDELPPREVRKLLAAGRRGRGMLIGVSTHDIEQAAQAVADGADYIGVGPVFPSSTKQFDAFPGIDFLKQIAATVALPAFAIGGINPGNLQQVIDTGLRRIAVQSTVTESPDPAATCRQIREMCLPLS